MRYLIKSYHNIVELLKDDVNCLKIVKFIKDHYEKLLGKGEEASVYRLRVKGYPIAVKIFIYNTTPGYIWQKEEDPIDEIWINKKIKFIQITTEAQSEGFHIFPYVYSYLSCPDDADSKFYIFYESFDGDLKNLIYQLTDPNDWYEIIFQICFIDYYLTNVKSYRYRDATPPNHLYKKIEPQVHTYQLNSHQFHIKQKYLICIWDIYVSDKKEKKIIRNYNCLLRFLKENRGKIKTIIPNELYQFIIEINKHPDRMVELLKKIYH